jgi:curved DNA-binding protein CbpA
LEKIVKRLEMIKNSVLLEDFKMLNYQIEELKKEKLPELVDLVKIVNRKNYSKVPEIVDSILLKMEGGVTQYIDPKVRGLRMEIKSLEEKLLEEEALLSKAHEFLEEFQRYILLNTAELQQEYRERLLEYMTLQFGKSEINEDEMAQKRAEFEEFQKNVERERVAEIQKIDKEMDDEIKRIYREASKLTHPDMVIESERERATETFQNLNKFYEEKNLLKLKEIHSQLNKGNYHTVSDSVSDIKLLKKEIKHLQKRINEVSNERIEFEREEIDRESWPFSLIMIKNKLDNDIQDLKREIKNLLNRKEKLEKENFRVIKAYKEKYDEIIKTTDSFVDKFLDGDSDYKTMFRELTARLSRKRPSPLKSGDTKSWAGGVIHFMLYLNFFFTRESKHYMTGNKFKKLTGITFKKGEEYTELIIDSLGEAVADNREYLHPAIEKEILVEELGEVIF